MNNELNQGLQVTGNDAIDLQAEIDALLNPDGQQTQAQTQQTQGIEVPVAGQKVVFKNPEELGGKLQEILRSYQAAQAENASLRAQVTQVSSQTNEKPAKKGSLNEQFTELVQSGEDGIAKAFDFALSHMFFDGKVPNAAKQIANVLQKAAQNDNDLTVLRFKEAHPELPRTQEAATIIDNVRQRYNLPFSVDGLDAAYALAVHNKLLTVEPVANTQSQAPAQQTQQSNSQFVSPPMSRQSGSTVYQPTPEQEEQLWNMPMEKLQQMFFKLHPPTAM